MIIQNILQNLIHPFMGKEVSPILILHKLHKDGIDRNPNQTVMAEGGWDFTNCVNHIQNVIASFLLQRLLALVKTIFPVHSKNRIAVDQFMELLDGW